MTDKGNGHADDEALSAHLDNEAPPPDHLAGCALCRARLDQLRGVSTLVSAPVAPPGLARERAVAAAVASAGPASLVPLGRRSRDALPWIAAAAAVLVVAALPFAFRGEGDGPNQAASPTLAPKTAGDLAAGAAPTGLGDLGDQGDERALAALLRARMDAGSQGAGRHQAPGDGADGAAAESAAPAVASEPACVPEAQALGGTSLGAPRSSGTLRWKGQPAVVLVFDVTPSGSSTLTRQVFVMSSPGCAPLVVQTF